MIHVIKEIREKHKKGIITDVDAIKEYSEIAELLSEIIEKKNRLVYKKILEVEAIVKDGHVTNMIDGIRDLSAMVRSIQQDESILLGIK